MSHCFRFLGRPLERDLWVVEGEELHHLQKVLRLTEGATIEVFTGQGLLTSGTIDRLTKETAQIKTSTITQVEKPKTLVGVGIGALRHGAIDEILPALVELGVNEIHIFLDQDDTKTKISSKAQDRWNRIILAASKQSKVAWLPILNVNHSLKSLMSEISPRFQHRFVLQPEANTSIMNIEYEQDSNCFGLIGCERGFASKELGILDEQAFIPVYLSQNILRSTTAAIAAATVFSLKRS